MDEVHQENGLPVADVVDPMGGGAGGGIAGLHGPGRVGLRLAFQKGHYGVGDIAHIGEVTLHGAFAVDIDGAAFQDGPGEGECGHVRPSPGPIDREEPQAGGGDPEEVGIAVGHHLVGLLGGGIEADGVVRALGGAERGLPVHAVDRAGTGVDEVPDAGVAAALQDRQMGGQIGVHIVEGVLEGIPDPRLGRQVDDAVETLLFKEGGSRGPIRQIHPDEAEALPPLQAGQSGLLQGQVVVGCEIIHTHELQALIQQAFGHMMGDESGGTGEEYLHGLILRVWDESVNGSLGDGALGAGGTRGEEEPVLAVALAQRLGLTQVELPRQVSLGSHHPAVGSLRLPVGRQKGLLGGKA